MKALGSVEVLSTDSRDLEWTLKNFPGIKSNLLILNNWPTETSTRRFLWIA